MADVTNNANSVIGGGYTAIDDNQSAPTNDKNVNAPRLSITDHNGNSMNVSKQDESSQKAKNQLNFKDKLGAFKENASKFILGDGVKHDSSAIFNDSDDYGDDEAVSKHDAPPKEENPYFESEEYLKKRHILSDGLNYGVHKLQNATYTVVPANQMEISTGQDPEVEITKAQAPEQPEPKTPNDNSSDVKHRLRSAKDNLSDAADKTVKFFRGDGVTRDSKNIFNDSDDYGDDEVPPKRQLSKEESTESERLEIGKEVRAERSTWDKIRLHGAGILGGIAGFVVGAAIGLLAGGVGTIPGAIAGAVAGVALGASVGKLTDAGLSAAMAKTFPEPARAHLEAAIDKLDQAGIKYTPFEVEIFKSIGDDNWRHTLDVPPKGGGVTHDQRQTIRMALVHQIAKAEDSKEALKLKKTLIECANNHDCAGFRETLASIDPRLVGVAGMTEVQDISKVEAAAPSLLETGLDEVLEKTEGQPDKLDLIFYGKNDAVKPNGIETIKWFVDRDKGDALRSTDRHIRERVEQSLEHIDEDERTNVAAELVATAKANMGQSDNLITTRGTVVELNRLIKERLAQDAEKIVAKKCHDLSNKLATIEQKLNEAADRAEFLQERIERNDPDQVRLITAQRHFEEYHADGGQTFQELADKQWKELYADGPSLDDTENKKVVDSFKEGKKAELRAQQANAKDAIEIESLVDRIRNLEAEMKEERAKYEEATNDLANLRKE
ncbi:MAG: hypothetical protein AAGC81_09335 [Pseudomonadota bacterium]